MFLDDLSKGIYDAFDADSYGLDVQGWGGHQSFFGQMVEETKPKLIIEVGSWKGKSAIAMANALRGFELNDSRVLCIDTWLGATEFVGKPDDDPKRGLRRAFGYPTIYYQFLANVVLTENQKRIIPFPQSSINAARFLQKNGVKADLIYVDGSHEYEDVVEDLKMYYPLLKKGGVIFGDDYCKYWGGVIKAVDEFAVQIGTGVTTVQYQNPEGEAPSDYWILRP